MKRPAAIQMIDDELFDPVDGRFDSATDTENEPIEPEIDPTTVPVTVPGVDGTEIVTVAVPLVHVSVAVSEPRVTVTVSSPVQLAVIAVEPPATGLESLTVTSDPSGG